MQSFTLLGTPSMLPSSAFTLATQVKNYDPHFLAHLNLFRWCQIYCYRKCQNSPNPHPWCLVIPAPDFWDTPASTWAHPGLNPIVEVGAAHVIAYFAHLREKSKAESTQMCLKSLTSCYCWSLIHLLTKVLVRTLSTMGIWYHYFHLLSYTSSAISSAVKW